MTDTILRKTTETADAAEVMAPGRLERLHAAGLDIMEGRREGPYIYDQHGTRYIDAISGAGTFNLGRRRPELVAELKLAVRETDQGNFPMISKEKAILAKTLADFVPGRLECVLFAVSRGEAFDAACKLARGHTGRPGLVTIAGGWYGHTGFALSMSERPDKDCYAPLIPDCTVIPAADAGAAKAAIGPGTAAFALELIQAENGCREMPREYVRAVADMCRQNGTMLIVDETQTNFGRSGSRFAYEAYGVEPDIVVIGEAMCGGMFPMAAAMMTPEVGSFMNIHPLIHLSTFGGSDIGCRVALRALELYAREHPWENAAMVGARLRDGLASLAGRPNLLFHKAAGRGLMVALEMENEVTALDFCAQLAKKGILTMPGMVAANTVVFRPPLNVTSSIVDTIIAGVADAAGL
jgi:acetylornithine/succinyldiaminopimelate/putrescine aminotransferase